ncbi:acyltransferase family protein [Dyadobacter sp. MSC1_007]|jgi:glucan biosynthesis protein C|uniref:acyltransferase family protein n=1 Tax=Dyadobacter sp. MSC1_007 TaxID=2909264 RepID=UPI00202F4164|nr:acyltransferase [Dyadobacter sp. MSC1_007]
MQNRTLWIDYLRSFITVLVVAHHSSLAYTTFASFDKVAYIRSTNPIVDNARWVGLDIFENFNDVFFMSLMFLIAGLFVVKSIQRKGTAAFLRDRLYRLFIPFLLIGTFINLVAHYPAYLIAHGNGNIRNYVIDFFAVEQWPVGPPWFIWVLFAFNAIFALIYALKKSLSPADKTAHAQGSSPQPRIYKTGLVIASWFLFTFALFVPFAFWLGPGKWTGFGPFDFQASRAALYFGYFLLGAWLGARDFNEGLFGLSSSLVRRWPLWLIACGGAYTFLTISAPFLTGLVKDGTLSELTGYLIYFSIYTASCTFSCIAFMTAFRALTKKENAVLDSLSEHAYLIYLMHYPFVIWAQYLLLDVPLAAFSKFLLTFLIALAGSWAVSIPLKKIGLIKKYI